MVKTPLIHTPLFYVASKVLYAKTYISLFTKKTRNIWFSINYLFLSFKKYFIKKTTPPKNEAHNP